MTLAGVTIPQIRPELLISVNLKLSSGEEDSSVEVEAYDPGFLKYLEASRFNLTCKVGNRELTFQCSVESYEFLTQRVRVVGNSAAWQFNQTRQYRVWQDKPMGDILRQLGVEVDSTVPSNLLSQVYSLVQNNTTDYRYAQSLCGALGIRLRGATDGRNKLLASYDLTSQDVALEVTHTQFQASSVCVTDVEGVSVTNLSLRQEDSQESSKDTVGNQKEVDSEAKTETEAQAKYQRIDPQTGARYTSKSDLTPVAATTDTAAKLKELSWQLDLIQDTERAPEFLLQPGDKISFVLTQQDGTSKTLGSIVDSVTVDFYPEHNRVSVECKQPSESGEGEEDSE